MLRILEISWLVILLVSILFGIYRWMTEGIEAAIWLFIFTFISGVFYVIRRRQRIAMEREQEQE